MTTIAPEACTPENVAALLRQIEQEEENSRKALQAHNDAIMAVREAARAPFRDRHTGFTMPWKDVIERIRTAVAAHLAADSMDAARYAELRKCYESANRCAELNTRRTDAYRNVVDQLRTLAKRRDPSLICYSGADMLAIINTLDSNPDV